MGEPAAHPVPPLAEEEPQPWLLDCREVAALLGIGRTKTFQMMARAELPVVRIGRCVRVPRSALERWIEGNINSTRAAALPLGLTRDLQRR